MPPQRKIDLIPEELRIWLREELTERGFGDIEEVTESLNFRLEEAGQEISIGKTAVGKYSKALKDQRDAFAIADTLLSDMNVEKEGELHQVLMQMIATSAVHMIQNVRNEEGHLDPKDLMNLGRMLKDLMSSSGLREKLLADERERVAKEAAAKERARMEAEIEQTIEDVVESEPGLSLDVIARLRRDFLGVKS
jgi:hypothetical protein